MKHTKKILLVTSEFPPQPGGIGNHAYNLASQLQQNGFEVAVMADTRSKNGLVEKQFDDALPFKVYRTKRFKLLIWTYLKRIWLYTQITRQYGNIIASGKFSLWLVGFGMLNTKVNRMAVIHGSEVNYKKRGPKKMTDAALKRFDQVVAVSNFTKSLVHHLKLNTVYVIPNGVNMDGFEQGTFTGELIGTPKLVTVGAISERKGQHNVIEKLPALIKTHPGIHYHMVGIPTEKEKLLKIATALEVENHITFHGMVTPMRLNEILSASDVFVMLSEQTQAGDVEGFGIALIEANFMGLPAIGSKNCGIEDAIKNKYSGVLIDPKSAVEFEDALVEILVNKTAYVYNAKQWALQHTWETVIIQYLKLLS